ncbi:hypothetical protein [Streptomyces sp. NPDC048295]|uniref:hypothetical protein n=1 Tax=Streptomyces sp. NPDC048295 TaxID=3154617 RepID=UPI003437F389
MKVVVLDDGSLMGVETTLWVRDHGHEVAVPALGGLGALTPQEVTDALRGGAVAVDLLHQPSPVTATFPARNDPHEPRRITSARGPLPPADS